MSDTLESTPSCGAGEHAPHQHVKRADGVMQEAATLFSALGDTSRLRLMELLFDGPHCVSELAEETGQSMSIISQRLKILHQARLVEKRREGKHIYYSLSDDHIVHLLKNAFDHVEEHNH